MVDRIFRVPPQDNPQVDRIKDDERQKRQNPEEEGEDQEAKKKEDAFDPKKQGPAYEQLFHTKEEGIPRPRYFTGRNLNKETGPKKDVSLDEMRTVIEQKERTFSETLKNTFRKSFVYRLGWKDPDTKRGNIEIILAYVTVFVVLMAFFFAVWIILF